MIENFMLLIAQNPALLDMTLLITSSIHDFVQRQSASVLTITHLRATLAHLNGLISNQSSKDHLMTIVFLALSLGNVAAIFGDYTAASAHIQGLQKIAMMQDGREYLDKFPKFNFKISRCVVNSLLSFPLFAFVDKMELPNSHFRFGA